MNSKLVKFTLDLGGFTFAALVAYFLRLDGEIGARLNSIFAYILLGLPVKYAVLSSFRLHRNIWRYVTFEDLALLTRAVAVTVGLLLLLTALARPYLLVPWSVPLLEGMIALALMGGVRLVTRRSLDRRKRGSASANVRRVLIAGAGDAGRLMAAELLRRPTGLELVGFIDDAPDKKGQRLMGVPVLGTLAELAELQLAANAELLIIAMPAAGGKVVRQYVEAARQVKLETRIVPGLYELVGGQVTVNQLRDVSVEDLLRRPPVELDGAAISAYLKDKTVLVTGAGGSIGSEIVRQIVRFHPRRIVLVGRGENSIFGIEQELRREWPEIDAVALIADVRSRSRLEGIFRAERPQVVFHAAAHKHVPLMESAPSEAVLNNIFGTRNVAELCLEYDVERLVNVSTDKAVNPTSVMGASKRVAEMVIADAARRTRSGQAFVSVRFGNVLGSRGSVVPTFMQQLRVGGPITVTHPGMTRYFMTIPEASRLVLQAGGLAQGGSVYLLNMGEPVKIVDLARDVIRLSGAQDVDIVYSGIRPGEKMYEELLTSRENVGATRHADIFAARLEQPDAPSLNRLLEALKHAADREDTHAIRRALHEAISESQLKV